MKQICFMMAFLILLSGSYQISAQKLKIFVSGDSNSKPAWTVEQYLKAKILSSMRDQYPCFNTLTDDELTKYLEWARQRSMMGNPDENALSNAADALGTQFLLSVSVIQVNSTITMNVSGMDQRRGKMVSRQGAVAQGGDEALDAAEALAEKFVSDFINYLPDCYVNEWVGTITYHRELKGHSQTTAEGYSSGITTTEITTESTAEASFIVRGEKKPARATVKWSEESLKNSITKQTIPCPVATPGESAKTVIRNVTEVEKTKGNADGQTDAVASVSVDGDEYTISFTVPEIEDGIAVRDWTLNDSGGCGPPWSDHQNNSVKWTSPELYEQTKGKIDHSKPDVLAGSQTVSGGSSLAPSMELTTIITWNLNFKRDPSTKK